MCLYYLDYSTGTLIAVKGLLCDDHANVQTHSLSLGNLNQSTKALGKIPRLQDYSGRNLSHQTGILFMPSVQMSPMSPFGLGVIL